MERATGGINASNRSGFEPGIRYLAVFLQNIVYAHDFALSATKFSYVLRLIFYL